MSHFDDFCDSLSQETLLEMAENFFGERVSIEDEKERFCAQAVQLNEQRKQALRKAALVHALLFTEENAHDYYVILGVPPSKVFAEIDPAKARIDFRPPFAFTSKGRFMEIFLKACAEQQKAFDNYMNGEYYKIPAAMQPDTAGAGDENKREGYALGGANAPQRKRLSMHYKLLTDWAAHINRRIRKVNEGLAPSCVLGFAHNMNPETTDKERITGATLDNYCCSLDQSLEISLVSCHEQGVQPLPELPDIEKFKKPLTSFAKQVYKAHKAEARALVKRLTSKPRH